MRPTFATWEQGITTYCIINNANAHGIFQNLAFLYTSPMLGLPRFAPGIPFRRCETEGSLDLTVIWWLSKKAWNRCLRHANFDVILMPRCRFFFFPFYYCIGFGDRCEPRPAECLEMLSTMKEAEIYRNTKRSLIKFSDKCKKNAVSGLLTRSFMLKHAPLSTATSGRHKRWLLKYIKICHPWSNICETCRIRVNLSPAHKNWLLCKIPVWCHQGG